MLESITKSISKFFGSKSDRDIKEIQPLVNEIHTAYASITLLSNDALRAKTAEFKKKLLIASVKRKHRLKKLRIK